MCESIINPCDGLKIRKMEEKDYPFILRVNEENVEVLSPMDENRIQEFSAWSELFLMAEMDGEPVAFLLALREGLADYDSENYLWFSKNYEKFLYIDRIVIDEPYRRRGVGRKLYQAVFRYAKEAEIPFVTAEIDTEPYNEVSLGFHQAMGFREVGTQMVRNNSIRVSLQEAAVKKDL
jgi:predicted GNAT superfamily acetyltransferase